MLVSLRAYVDSKERGHSQSVSLSSVKEEGGGRRCVMGVAAAPPNKVVMS